MGGHSGRFKIHREVRGYPVVENETILGLTEISKCLDDAGSEGEGRKVRSSTFRPEMIWPLSFIGASLPQPSPNGFTTLVDHGKQRPATHLYIRSHLIRSRIPVQRFIVLDGRRRRLVHRRSRVHGVWDNVRELVSITHLGEESCRRTGGCVRWCLYFAAEKDGQGRQGVRAGGGDG